MLTITFAVHNFQGGQQETVATSGKVLPLEDTSSPNVT